MSALGQKRTLLAMPFYVCFTPNSGHKSTQAGMSALCQQPAFKTIWADPSARGVTPSHTIPCLVFTLAFCNLSNVIKRIPYQVVIALLLGLFMAAGLGPSAMSSNAMAVEMAATDHGGMAGGDCCPGCPDEQHNNSADCAMTCAFCVTAVSSDNSGITVLGIPANHAPGAMAAQRGRVRVPEPDPPKTSDLS